MLKCGKLIKSLVNLDMLILLKNQSSLELFKLFKVKLNQNDDKLNLNWFKNMFFSFKKKFNYEIVSFLVGETY